MTEWKFCPRKRYKSKESILLITLKIKETKDTEKETHKKDY